MQIDVANNPSIRLASGAQSVKSLFSREDVTIAGGSLALSSSSQVEARLTLSGGTLDGAGDLTINGTMDWSAGNLSGIGKLTIAPIGLMNIAGTSSFSTNLLGKTIENQGTINYTGLGFTFGKNASDTATINNLTGATFARQAMATSPRQASAAQSLTNLEVFSITRETSCAAVRG